MTNVPSPMYSPPMGKIWAKGYELNALVERFTVGRDFILDRELLPADCAASVAHARMLATVGLISPEAAAAIESELRAIAAAALRGEVPITAADEDGHTVIEARLIAALGDPGKQVHTGRSRNDQVLAATRLYTRERLLNILERLGLLVSRLLDRAVEHEKSVMPGRTHLQVAMLSTMGLWFASWAEQLLDDAALLKTLFDLNNRSPLGSAASYGVPLPLDREYVAARLGFNGVQNNVLSVQSSRGKLDSQILSGLADVATTLGRMAADLILFSLPELGYVSLPEQLCTGSSIMPQKRNPDALELLRAKAASVGSWAGQVRAIVRNLPSGYNRDLQETKEPLLRGMDQTELALAVAELMVGDLAVNVDAMEAALTPGLFATDYAYQLVGQGVPFRDAYRRAAREYATISVPDAEAARLQRTSTGTPGNLHLDSPRAALHELSAYVAQQRERHSAATADLLGVASVLPVEGPARQRE